MIDFEEELKHYAPTMEIEDAEDAIHNTDLTDLTDLMRDIMRKGEEKPSPRKRN